MNFKKRGAKVTDSKLLDSSVWISYFFEGKWAEEIEAEKPNFLSVLSLFEIKTRLIKKKVKAEEIKEKINFIKGKSIILDVTLNIAEKAAEISSEKSIPAIDSLIYASSFLNKHKLITLDNDFRGLDNVIIL